MPSASSNISVKTSDDSSILLRLHYGRALTLESALKSFLTTSHSSCEDALFRARIKSCLELSQDRSNILKGIPVRGKRDGRGIKKFVNSVRDVGDDDVASERIATLELVYHQFLATMNTLSLECYLKRDLRAAADLLLCREIARKELRTIISFDEHTIHCI